MLEMFCLMLFAHALADYPLQGDYLARAKNHTSPLPGTPWLVALAAHGVINGGFVGLLSGSILIGLSEAVLHCCIDYAKSGGRISYMADQAMHVGCKAIWVLALQIDGGGA